MALSDIRKVKESYSDMETNEYLDKGYELIKIISSRTATIDMEEIKPCYVLGLRNKKSNPS